MGKRNEFIWKVRETFCRVDFPSPPKTTSLSLFLFAPRKFLKELLSSLSLFPILCYWVHGFFSLPICKHSAILPPWHLHRAPQACHLVLPFPVSPLLL